MGLDLAALTMLLPVFRGSAKQVLSLGYPDVVVPIDAVNKLFNISLKEPNPRNAGAMEYHQLDFSLPNTEEFFSKMGSTLRCVDYKALFGNEIVADLNEPCDLGQYDLVIDPGTLEHCFNVATAFKNAAKAVKPGGFIFHCNPLSMVNHGFYMFSPTFYCDFYSHNKWRVVEQMAGDGKQWTRIPAYERVAVHSELCNYVLAKRPENSPNIRDDFPIQAKYQAMLT